jgi:hypothetical protein
MLLSRSPSKLSHRLFTGKWQRYQQKGAFLVVSEGVLALLKIPTYSATNELVLCVTKIFVVVFLGGSYGGYLYFR